MKYKVGDKVLVRGDLNDDDEYWMEDGSQCNHATLDMVKLKSKVCTIKSIHNGQYKLEEDPEQWNWTDEMFAKSAESKREWVWGGSKSTLKVKEMTTSHVKNSINILKRMNPDEMLEDGHLVKEWIDTFNRELAYRKITPESRVKLAITDEPVKQYIDKDIELTEQFIIKENKENIKMTNADLIDTKLQKELDALGKAERKEIKDKFYETSIGKAAKAFNEALEQDGNENQKENYLIDMDDLMERSEEFYSDEIDAKYKAKREETREYYNEAKNLFLNADTYEQKVEILTSYGILKGPKVTKAKVEVK